MQRSRFRPGSALTRLQAQTQAVDAPGRNACTLSSVQHELVGAQREFRFAVAPCAMLPPMPLILILVVLLLLFGGGGYYMGPGLGYYGGGGLDLILVLVILYLLFGRGRRSL